MLRNNTDARRCSYFKLGLPVDKHVHVLSIFVKKKKNKNKKKQNKTIQLYCFDERKLQQNSEGKGKNAKQSFASYVLSLLLCAMDEEGKINRLPR